MFSKLVFDLDGIQVDVHLHEVVALLQQIVGSSIQNSSSNLQVPNYTGMEERIEDDYIDLMETFIKKYEELYGVNNYIIKKPEGNIKNPLSYLLKLLYKTNMTYFFMAGIYEGYSKLLGIIKPQNKPETCAHRIFEGFVIPKHIYGMRTIFDWFELSEYLSSGLTYKKPTHGWWVSIGRRLLLIKNNPQKVDEKKKPRAEENDEADDGQFYISDHGLIDNILDNIQQCIDAFSWGREGNRELLLNIFKFWNNYESFPEIDKEKLKEKFCLKLDDEIIQDISRLHFLLAIEGLDLNQRNQMIGAQRKRWSTMDYAPPLSDKAGIGGSVSAINKYGHIFENVLEQFRYITMSFLQKYILLSFRDGYNPFYTQLNTIMNQQDVDYLIAHHALSALAKEVNSGQHQPLFRPIMSYGHRDSGAPYHKFAQAVSNHFKIAKNSNSAQLASKMRSLLTGSLNETDSPSFLPNLVAAWFIAEPVRYRMSLISGLMLLDLMENNIRLLDDNGDNRYSLYNTLVHPENDSYKKDKKIRVKDLYGNNVTPFEMGGCHPMTHKGSVKDSGKALRREKLSIVHQKEGSIILHWLYLRLKESFPYINVKLLSTKESKLENTPDYSEVVSADGIIPKLEKLKDKIRSSENLMRAKKMKADIVTSLIDMLSKSFYNEFDKLVEQFLKIIKGDNHLQAFVDKFKSYVFLSNNDGREKLIQEGKSLKEKYDTKKQEKDMREALGELHRVEKRLSTKQAIMMQLAEILNSRVDNLNKAVLYVESYKPGLLKEFNKRSQKRHIRPVAEPKRNLESFLNAVSREYLEMMRNSSRNNGDVLWGGDIELKRIAIILGLSIIVYKNGVPNPKIGDSPRTIYLRLIGGHYELITDVNTMQIGYPSVSADGNCLFNACIRGDYYLNTRRIERPSLKEISELREKVCNFITTELSEDSFLDDFGKRFKITEAMRIERDDIRQQFSNLIDSTDDNFLDCLEALPSGKLRDEAVSIRAYLIYQKQIKLELISKHSQENNIDRSLTLNYLKDLKTDDFRIIYNTLISSLHGRTLIYDVFSECIRDGIVKKIVWEKQINDTFLPARMMLASNTDAESFIQQVVQKILNTRKGCALLINSFEGRHLFRESRSISPAMLTLYSRDSNKTRLIDSINSVSIIPMQNISSKPRKWF